MSRLTTAIHLMICTIDQRQIAASRGAAVVHLWLVAADQP